MILLMRQRLAGEKAALEPGAFGPARQSGSLRHAIDDEVGVGSLCWRCKLGGAHHVWPDIQAIEYEWIRSSQDRTELQPVISQSQHAGEGWLRVDRHDPDKVGMVDLGRKIGEQHAWIRANQQRQFAGEAILDQRIQAGQQHVFIHPRQGVVAVRGSQPAAQHQFVGRQPGGRIEQRLERQETRAQGFFADRLGLADAQHLGDHDRLLEAAGVDAAPDDGGRGKFVVRHVGVTQGYKSDSNAANLFSRRPVTDSGLYWLQAQPFEGESRAEVLALHASGRRDAGTFPFRPGRRGRREGHYRG
ncbi:MAG: hypothetical protein MUE59_07015 [Thiobacillaceae bacterium]|nr:hypothetical protein [Thiobacillaceae bacterium]